MISHKDNFLVAHYEWIAAVVALAVLVWGGIRFASTLGEDADERAAAVTRQINGFQPSGTGVAGVDLSAYARAVKSAKVPATLAEIRPEAGSFLASAARVWCDKCHGAVPAGGKTCPVCGYERPEEKKAVADADQDGLPDSWEKQYALNPDDASDAAADADGDGFTNLEEFTAGTNPKDKSSHPDYFASLALQLPLKQTFLPFHFTGVYKTPGGLKFQFKNPNPAKDDFSRGVYSVLAGEPIGKSGYSAKAYVQKSEKRKMGGGMEKSVDVSEAVVTRKGDGREIRMVINRKQIPVDSQATVVFTRGEVKTFVVVAGDEIDLYGTKYIVKDITRTGKKVTVTFEESLLKKVHTLEALEQ